MGLTIHYKLKGPVRTTAAKIRALVGAMRTRAVAMQRAGGVKAVGTIKSGAKEFLWLSEWLMIREDEHTSRGVEVPVTKGFVFTVTMGEGSEPLRLGLCQYPARVRDRVTGRMRAVRRTGWRLSTFCKTQYASLHGWENFYRCHTAAVDLLAGLGELGLRVEISDEGEYWSGRDEAGLRRKIDEYNGIVAAFAGMMKDAGDDDDRASPIFAHPRFERIEAAGHAANAVHLRAAANVLRSAKRGTTD
jgi:hypothetical protein